MYLQNKNTIKNKSWKVGEPGELGLTSQWPSLHMVTVDTNASGAMYLQKKNAIENDQCRAA